MGYWKNLWGALSGSNYRQKGLQSGTPGYSDTPATPVTEDSALQVSVAWACARIITESIASLPLKFYKINSDGTRTENNIDHPLALLFSGKVNKWQTKQEYFETITHNFVLRGNDYSLKQYGTQNKLIGLVPLMNDQVKVDLDGNGNIIYEYSENGQTKKYTEKEIWHNKLFGNGVIGLSPLAYARLSLGIAQAAEKAVSNIYRNGGKPAGVLAIEKTLTKEQRAEVKTNFAGVTEGNSDRLFVLEAGMKYTQVSLSPQDIELLSSRRFQIEDICRFFNVPSILVNDSSASTAWGSGIQQIIQGFYKFGLRPYLERYEASIRTRLLTPEERMEWDIEFDFEALLRPDLADRIKTYGDGIRGGIITPNEARAKEGWSQQPGGDKLYMQQQMVVLGEKPQKQNGGIQK